MTRDYRSRAQQESKTKKPPTPAWVPFFYGFLTGTVVVAVAWILLTPPGTPLVWPEFSAQEQRIVKKSSSASAEQEQPERPRFDFYTILPEMEVVISDEEAAPPDADDQVTKVTQKKNVSYRLQVGSFRKMSDADRQKARLALLGVEADIQKVNIGQGDIYYRVLTMPFDNKQELNEKRKMFQKNRINSLVVQMKN